MFIAKLFSESVYENDSEAFLAATSEQREAIKHHNFIARKVCQIIDLPTEEFEKQTKEELENFYDNLSDMLLDYPRLTLFVPFYILKNATISFRKTYLKTWETCCKMSDTREEFNIGDYYEPDASIGEPDHVAKAAHLLPWLLKYGYLNESDIIKLANKYRDDDSIAIWGLLDGAVAAKQIGILNESALEQIMQIAKKAKTECPKPPKLILVTEKRKKWLKDLAANYGIDRKTFKLRNPAGPYSSNIEPQKIDAVLPTNKHEHLILQGSRLKGYSRPGSDYDYFIYDDRDHKIYSYDKEKGKEEISYLTQKLELASHLILLGAWLGESKNDTLAAQRKAASYYYRMNKAQQAIALFSIERTTIQCRLMQKGFPCAYVDLSLGTKNLNTIDGSSAFYDERMRKIATKICIKYIFLGRRISLATWRKTLSYTTPPMIG
ncbi:hypothetical protein IKQ74_02570 [Candidatus Saccharibacteria bacterium]|nr:hypothetical protein [Candidatus Saccharibacteria bacterium]